MCVCVCCYTEFGNTDNVFKLIKKTALLNKKNNKNTLDNEINVVRRNLGKAPLRCFVNRLKPEKNKR